SGEKGDHNLLLETNVIVRQSCGCIFSDTVKDLSSDDISNDEGEGSADVGEVSTEQKVAYDFDDLFAKLKTDASNKKHDMFIPAFDLLMRTVVTSEEQIPELNQLLSRFRKMYFENECRPLLSAKRSLFSGKTIDLISESVEKYYIVETIINQCRMMVGNRSEQVQVLKKIHADNVSTMMHYVGQRILTSFRNEDLFDVLYKELPGVGIDRCYITQCPDGGSATLVFALEAGSGHTQKSEEFPCENIIPERIWNSMTDHNLIVESLSFRGESLGFIIYAVGPKIGAVYETFSSEISNAIKGIMLYDEQTKVEKEIREKSEHIQSLVIPMLDSIREITNSASVEVDKARLLSETTSVGLVKLKEANEITGNASKNITTMLEMINIIDEISSSINVLAINATIESAHAGDYGRGFSIIAKEVKRLSDTTAENARQISESLQDVVNSIQAAMTASSDNYNRFSKIDDHARQVTKLFNDILEKMSHLTVSSNEILEQMNAKK
ncbi:MAG TPA: methyl-accepting chemotaxis protein, partial [Spirochaetota bacterium]